MQERKIKKLLIICGPTATGKTFLSAVLAKKFKGGVISADSKQVYKGMDIGTGKDRPLGIKIWGYDLVGPEEEFSVAQYVKFAREKIASIQKKGKLPILVGGTGLYIKAIVDGIPTVKIPRNEALRENLAAKMVVELFEMLAQLDPIRAGSMNTSDRKNPRRLIRAIEIAQAKLQGLLVSPNESAYTKNKVLFIGLTAPKDKIFERIEKRVKERVEAGLEGEIKSLLKSGVSWEDQSMSSLGYRQWKGYFEGKEKKEEVIKKWAQEEKKYAKRQITWFKKDKRISWFDITKPNLSEKVEKLVKKWYS